MPSASFGANAAWLTPAAIAHNLTRAAGALASLFHAHARTGTLRRHLITVPARIARRSRRITVRLPLNWPHQHAFDGLFTATHAPPRTAWAAQTPDPSGPTGYHSEKAGQTSIIPTPATEHHDPRYGNAI
jgi:hypothetical protein